MSGYKVKREKVTLVLGHDGRGRQRISHPLLAVVYVGNEAVHAAETVADAHDWATRNIEPTVCEEDSGSATDCRPICDRPATHSVTVNIPCYGPSVSRKCKRHAEHSAARHYPYTVAVATLTKGTNR